MPSIKTLSVICAGLSALAITAPYAADAYTANTESAGYIVVRVIGYDCDGANGPLLASEEDQLPSCAAIEALPEAWAIPTESTI